MYRMKLTPYEHSYINWYRKVSPRSLDRLSDLVLVKLPPRVQAQAASGYFGQAVMARACKDLEPTSPAQVAKTLALRLHAAKHCEESTGHHRVQAQHLTFDLGRVLRASLKETDR